MAKREQPPAKSTPTTYVAIACWIDLLGYGSAINAAGFDPAHPGARAPLKRLRAFQRIVADHSSTAFPTLVMNDGAVAYANVDMSRNDSIWRFIERCWRLFNEVSTSDRASGAPGLRGVISVGLRAKGSSRGIVAQQGTFDAIIDDLAAGRIDAAAAHAAAKKVRRVFDIVPQLQANFAFTRAYEAEQSGSAGGLGGGHLFLDTTVFRAGIPEWMETGVPVPWNPKKEALTTSFVAIRNIRSRPVELLTGAFRTGRELLQLLGRNGEIAVLPVSDPCLYKYTSFETAQIVLATGRLRWTTPPLLNDPYDLSFDLHVEFDGKSVREMALDILWADYLDDSQPAPQQAFELWKRVLKLERPNLDRAGFDRLAGPIVNRSIARSVSTKEMNEQLQKHLQRTKLLCLTDTPTNMLMWAHYGQQHFGAVLRFTRDGDENAFSAARPVTYAQKMPRYADGVALARLIAGRLQNAKKLSDSQIFTKASEWRYEREWRIQFGFGRDEDAAFEDLPFGAEQLTGVILGCRMAPVDCVALAAVARRLNPDVEILVARPTGREFEMMLEPWKD